ncbi:MAG: DeoR/GlpR family DNA-binding transcription regulator [Planctomycetota bacterium]|nr:DeoR/GlpR family DNA-binding transcription regulator [Planctomycetota bacterium]
MAAHSNIETRRAMSADILSQKGFMSLAELASAIGVSESTARRDLEALERQGTVTRTHGGAVYVKSSPTHSLAFADRQTTAVAEKEAIARAVAELIPSGQTVILNGGTTCCQVARAIQGRHLNVITNSVPIGSLLSADLATEVTLIGGYVYPRTGVALGAMAEQQIAGLHATQLIFSSAGVTDQEAFNANQMMVDVERRMMDIAEKIILVADHTKFGMRSVVKLCDLNEVDVIVTDSGADAETLKRLKESGPKVIVAEL